MQHAPTALVLAAIVSSAAAAPPAALIGDDAARGADPCPDCDIEVSVLLDQAMFTRFADAADDIAADILTRVYHIFHTPPGDGGLAIRVPIGQVTVFDTADPWAPTTSATALLANVESYAASTPPFPGDQRDIEILITGVDLSGAVIALTHPGSVCTPQGVGVVEYFSTDHDRMAQVVARTIALMIGAHLDGVANDCDPSGFIMGALTTPPATEFSSCTPVEVADFFAANPSQALCLASPRCNDADQAVPFGALDFSDVFAFLTSFGAGGPDADLAPPYRVLDFSDVLEFLAAFGAGCP